MKRGWQPVSSGDRGSDRGTRRYREGDSPRRVDWRSAAKGRELRTKLDEEETVREAVVLLDLFMPGRGGSDALLDRCASAALKAVRDGLASRRSIRLLAQGRMLLASPGTDMPLSRPLCC